MENSGHQIILYMQGFLAPPNLPPPAVTTPIVPRPYQMFQQQIRGGKCEKLNSSYDSLTKIEFYFCPILLILT